MVHQCQSEGGWFVRMFGITAPGPVVPGDRTRLSFLAHYAAAAEHRRAALAERPDAWWEQHAPFFEMSRPRTWIMTRRIAHTAHHRGQQLAFLRMLGRSLHSTYGPTADTGGLPKDEALVVYAYADVDALLAGEAAGGRKAPLPSRVAHPVTELPDD
jgi:hypothetical protein